MRRFDVLGRGGPQITDDRIPELVEESTYEALSAVGHGTLGFLDYVFAFGATGGRAPDVADKTGACRSASA